MNKAPERGRITAKVSSEVEEMLKQAAALTDMSVSQFMIQAALTHAQKIIDRELFIKASRADAELMLEILSRPAQPNAALLALSASQK
jgi:uncharacterized protein (DUF1778 family)